VVRTFLLSALAGLLLAAGPAVSQDATGDWGGAYGGVQFGVLGGDASGSADGDGSGPIAGLHAGYGVDFGTFVLGAEVDLDFGAVDLGDGAEVDSLARLKLRAGADLGRTFVYGTAGIARADTSLGTGDGGFAGIGAGWKMGARMTLGGEVLYQEFDDVDGSGVDLGGTTATARVTFSF
jgi:outer membrane immunogenic protein